MVSKRRQKSRKVNAAIPSELADLIRYFKSLDIGGSSDNGYQGACDYYLREFYQLYGDQAFDLIYGFENLYGLTLIACLHNLPVDRFMHINGNHLYKVRKELKNRGFGV